jgi:hypothetical protein
MAIGIGYNNTYNFSASNNALNPSAKSQTLQINPFKIDQNESNQSSSALNKDLSKDSNELQIKAQKQTGITDCLTCKTRKYQDGSNDPGVSFKSPGHISPEASASVVMGHEREHVSNETNKAKSEGRKVISQNVTLQTSMCAECGKVYVSGGKTTTVTKSDNNEKQDYFKDLYKNNMTKNFGMFVDSKV